MIHKQDNGKWKADAQPGGRGCKRYRKTFDRKADALACVRRMEAKNADDPNWSPERPERRRLSELIELWQQAPARADRIERCLIAFWLREYAWAWAEQHHGNIRSEIEAQLANSREKLAQLTS